MTLSRPTARQSISYSRSRTGGSAPFDAALNRYIACCRDDKSEWDTREFLATLDREVGGDTFTRLYRSHVASTDQDRFGKIFRRNMPYGTVTEHGTMFVGFCSEQRPLAAMLESMAGSAGGTRDALTRYTSPLTGAYYFIPSTDALRRVTDAGGPIVRA